MMNLLDDFQRIDTFIFDVDGVMTDGGIFVFQNGEMARKMNTKDGYALQLAVKKKYRFFIVTGSSPSAVKIRMNNLGIEHVYFNVRDKKAFVQDLINEHGLQKENILFMGDDLPDLPVFDVVGLGCCPADAVDEVKHAATYIAVKKGGCGCVREVIEKVLKCNNDWTIEKGIVST